MTSCLICVIAFVLFSIRRGSGEFKEIWDTLDSDNRTNSCFILMTIYNISFWCIKETSL